MSKFFPFIITKKFLLIRTSETNHHLNPSGSPTSENSDDTTIFSNQNINKNLNKNMAFKYAVLISNQNDPSFKCRKQIKSQVLIYSFLKYSEKYYLQVNCSRPLCHSHHKFYGHGFHRHKTTKQNLSCREESTQSSIPALTPVRRENIPLLNLRTKNQIFFFKKRRNFFFYKLKLLENQIKCCRALYRLKWFSEQNVEAKLLHKRKLHYANSIKKK